MNGTLCENLLNMNFVNLIPDLYLSGNGGGNNTVCQYVTEATLA